MAKRERGTLKRFFEKGALPSADHFADFIDSGINIRDDGIQKTPKHGLQLSAIDNEDALLSLYHKVAFDDPSWTLKYNGSQTSNLDLIAKPASDGEKTVLSISDLGRVGINNVQPNHELDINGTLSTTGLSGKEPKPVMADGQWYDITEGLEGVQCFAITAAVGIPDTDMHALLRCTASGVFEHTSKWTNWFSLSRRFKTQHTYYSSFSHRIRIRWRKKQDNKYYLQLRTKCDYNYFAKRSNKAINDGIRIRYNIVSLWHDHRLVACNAPLSDAEKEYIEDVNNRRGNDKK